MPTEEMTREEEFEEFRRSRYPDERSRELAQRAFAEKKGETPTRGQAAMTAASQFGAGKREGPVTTFTDPQGFTKTFRTEDGSLISEGTPIHYSNRYSPYDQRKLEKLYQERSRIATDPSIDEDARQRALDMTDDDISRVPMIAPIMRQPSAQEKFNASIITTPDGKKGTMNPRTGAFTPFPEDKAEAERQKDYRETYGRILERNMREDESLKEPRGFDVVAEETKLMTDMIFGRLGEGNEPGYVQAFSEEIAPNLKSDWDALLVNMEDKYFGRASEKQMLGHLTDYIQKAVAKGIHPNIATADFFKRWRDAAKTAGVFKDDIVAPFSKEMEKKLEMAKLVASHPDTANSGLAKQSRAFVNGKEVPLPQGPVARVNGRDIPLPSQQGRVRVRDKNGRVGSIPANELQEALANGFTQVE